FTVKDPTPILVPNSGTAMVFSGDEAESDLDLEYSSTIGKGATIYFVYTGNNQNYNVWDSIQYAVDHKVAPILRFHPRARCKFSISLLDKMKRSYAPQAIPASRGNKSEPETSRVVSAVANFTILHAIFCEPDNARRHGDEVFSGVEAKVTVGQLLLLKG